MLTKQTTERLLFLLNDFLQHYVKEQHENTFWLHAGMHEIQSYDAEWQQSLRQQGFIRHFTPPGQTYGFCRPPSTYHLTPHFWRTVRPWVDIVHQLIVNVFIDHYPDALHDKKNISQKWLVYRLTSVLGTLKIVTAWADALSEPNALPVVPELHTDVEPTFNWLTNNP